MSFPAERDMRAAAQQKGKQKEEEGKEYETGLRKGEALYLFGRGVVRVTRGTAELNGVLLAKKTGARHIDAPFCGPAAALVAGGGGAEFVFSRDNTPAPGAAHLYASPFEGSKEHTRHQKRARALMAAHGVEAKPVGVLDRKVPGLYVVTQEYLASDDARSSTPLVPRMCLSSRATRIVDEIVEGVLDEEDDDEDEETRHDAQSVVVCGARGTGKATLAKHIANSLLQRTGDAVAWLEADLATPEFGPCGLVSLFVLDRCVSGPAFAHTQQPDTAYYHGGTSPSEDTEAYLSIVHALLERYGALRRDVQRRGGTLHLVVNTGSWVTGTGYDCLRAMCLMAAPRHIVQLVRRDHSLFGAADEELLEERGAQLHAVEAMQADQIQACVPATARQLRDARLLAYFHDHVTPLLSAPVYCVPFHALTLVPLSNAAQHIRPEDVFHVLNGALVALCACDPACFAAKNAPAKKTTQSSMPRIVLPREGATATNPLVPCVCLAIVRSINVQRRFFEFICPISPVCSTTNTKHIVSFSLCMLEHASVWTLWCRRSEA